MITLVALRIYQKYNGDGDDFVRFATFEEKQIVDYKTWRTIENLLQDLRLIKNGMGSEEYVKEVSEKIEEVCDSTETRTELKSMAM